MLIIEASEIRGNVMYIKNEIADILGTRPEIIKTLPVIRESERPGLDYFILHTGLYYSYNLDVGAGTHAEETGKMPILEKLYLYVKN